MEIKSDKNEKVIYIGPNMYRFDLMQNRIFNEKPKIAQELIQKCPLIDFLFVPLSKINQSVNALRSSSTPEALAVKQLKEMK